MVLMHPFRAHRSRTRSVGSLLTTVRTVASATVLLATLAQAQTRSVPVPDAPAPKPSPLVVTLANHPVSPGIAADLSSPLPSSGAGDLSLYTTVDLALRNSRAVRVAEAERQRIRATRLEARDVYIPNFSVGSGLGYSFGFPLGSPTLFNVTSNSLLFSFSQRDYIRAASQALKAATLSLKDVREKVILDASLNYVDLNKTLTQIHALHQATADTQKLIGIIEDRLHAGVGTDIELTEAQLTGAKIHLQTIQMEDHANEVRQHLSNLTGLNPALIDPAASSIPPLPSLDFSSLLDSSKKSASVKAAVATANAKMYTAWGDEKQNYRPTIQFAFQYARFASFNNYQEYYNAKNFQFDNFGIGIQMTWPLFDPLRRDQAMESEAAARRAREQAELARIQDNESNFALWHGLRELEAQAEVARLEQKLAKDALASAVIRMNGTSTSANGAPVTPQQAEQTRINERNRTVSLEDAQFNVIKAKLELLRAIGELESWARQSSQNPMPKSNGTQAPAP